MREAAAWRRKCRSGRHEAREAAAWVGKCRRGRHQARHAAARSWKCRRGRHKVLHAAARSSGLATGVPARSTPSAARCGLKLEVSARLPGLALRRNPRSSSLVRWRTQPGPKAGAPRPSPQPTPVAWRSGYPGFRNANVHDAPVGLSTWWNFRPAIPPRMHSTTPGSETTSRPLPQSPQAGQARRSPISHSSRTRRLAVATASPRLIASVRLRHRPPIPRSR